MNSYVFSLILIVLLGAFGNSLGYKWMSLDFTENELPSNAVHVYKSTRGFVGRAKYFGKVLPAEVTENPIKCVITACNKLEPKHECEILVTDESDSCDWLPNSNDDSDENSLRLGTDSENEPTFLGASKTDGKYRINGIFLASEALHSWIGSDLKEAQYYYQCDPRTKWIDVSNDDLPNNTISGGQNDDGQDIYIARLEDDCNVFTGHVISGSKTASALSHESQPIESSNYQVLVGDENDYGWVLASNGEIPDYAVVQGKNGFELEYVVRYNNTIGHMTHKMAHTLNMEYEVLIYNYNNN